MKIGILTFIRAINDGAVLQAVALQQLLQTHLPNAQIELIDYQTQTIERQERRRLIQRRPPFFNRHKWQKRRSLQRFLRAEAQVSVDALISDDTNTAQKFIAKQGYDAIVVGSDVVWQTRAGRAIPPPPNIFFLPDIAAKKVSFSASADLSQRDQWATGNHRKQIHALLADFSFITVRDQTTFDYLAHLGVDKAHYLPDPTLLYDIGRFATIPHHLKSPTAKVAGVAVSHSQLRQQLTQQFRKQGYEIINLLGHASADQLNPPFHTLQQRLGVYALLDFMVTDRFHGSIFTLTLSDCPTVFVEPAVKYPAADSKGRDLFTRLNILPLVYRFDGQPISPTLITDFDALWRQLNPDIPAQLAALKAAAQPTLNELLSHLR